MKRLAISAVVICAFVWTGTAFALDPDVKCQAAKNKDAGKYAFCRQKAEMKYLKTADLTKYNEALAKCDAQFFDKWQKAEDKAGSGICPDGIADPNTVADFITEHADSVAAKLSGERYVPQNVGGDATVIDLETGLEWVVTDDAGGLTDTDNFYTWSLGGPDYLPDGTAFTAYIAGLNAANYGGHNDWRLPTSGGCCGYETAHNAELESIVDLSAPGCGGGSPCIDESVFGPTQATGYWSASTDAGYPGNAWSVFFGTGLTFNLNKTLSKYVRAVRTGP